MEAPIYTITWLMRRKPGISFEQFRDHYESSHAELGKRYLGHLLLGYRRHYNVPRPAPAEGADLLDRAFAAKAWDYDVVTEWDLRDEDSLRQVFAILSDPAIGRIFHDDEEHFLDRSSVRLCLRDSRDTGTGDGSGAPVPASGEPAGGNLWNL